MTFRDRVRAWLFGEEIRSIGTIVYECSSLEEQGAQGINQHGMMLRELAAVRTELAAIKVLLEPTVQQLQRERVARPLFPPDWAQIERESVEVFKEKD